MPCLANDPMPGVTAQRPQIPRAPQTESMSTPSERAASRMVVPAGTWPRRPDGVKMTCGSAVAVASLMVGSRRPSADQRGTPPIDAPAAGLALRRLHAESADPAGGVLVVAHQHVGGHDAVADALGDRVGDRGGESTGDRHRQERPVDALAV